MLTGYIYELPSSGNLSMMVDRYDGKILTIINIPLAKDKIRSVDRYCRDKSVE